MPKEHNPDMPLIRRGDFLAFSPDALSGRFQGMHHRLDLRVNGMTAALRSHANCAPHTISRRLAEFLHGLMIVGDLNCFGILASPSEANVVSVVRASNRVDDHRLNPPSITADFQIPELSEIIERTDADPAVR